MQMLISASLSTAWGYKMYRNSAEHHMGAYVSKILREMPTVYAERRSGTIQHTKCSTRTAAARTPECNMTFMSQTDLKKELTVAPPSPTTCSSLVVGEHRISRSVLLLAAVTAASEMGMRVIFFTQTQIQSLPVSLQKCVPGLSPETLKKIKFSYPRTVEELLQQVASLHESTNMFPTPPSLIVVDRLEGYLCGPGSGSRSGFHAGEQSCAAHLSALLCDSAAFLTQLLKQRSSGSGPCRLIASFQSEVGSGQASLDAFATDPILDVLDRYFQVRCTLDQDSSSEAAAAGLQEVWHIYLSGTGITEASNTTDCEDRTGAAQEWQLEIYPDGLMEFKLV